MALQDHWKHYERSKVELWIASRSTKEADCGVMQGGWIGIVMRSNEKSSLERREPDGHPGLTRRWGMHSGSYLLDSSEIYIRTRSTSWLIDLLISLRVHSKHTTRPLVDRRSSASILFSSFDSKVLGTDVYKTTTQPIKLEGCSHSTTLTASGLPLPMLPTSRYQ